MTREELAVLAALDSTSKPWTPEGMPRPIPSGTKPIPDALGRLGNFLASIEGTPLEYLMPMSGTLEAWGRNQKPSYLTNMLSALDLPVTAPAAAAGAVLGKMASRGVDGAVSALGPLGRQLGAFGGIKAANAPLDMLEIAKEAEAKGMPKERIMDATGWFKGADDKWRFEIDDSASALTPWEKGKHGQANVDWTNREGVPTAIAASDYLDHPAIEKAYWPTREQSPNVFFEQGTYAGRYNEPSDTISMNLFRLPDDAAQRSTAVHEVQHAVQGREGFARGGSKDTAQQAYWDFLRDEYKRLGGFTETATYDDLSARRSILRKAEDIIALENIKKPSDLFGSSYWYEYSTKVRDELGPTPKRNATDYARKAGKIIADEERAMADWRIANELRLYGNDRDALKKQIRSVSDKIKRMPIRNIRKAKEIRGLMDQYDPHNYQLSDIERHALYRRLAGETEARNVQARLGLSADDRRMLYPWLTQDVPNENQIVRFR